MAKHDSLPPKATRRAPETTGNGGEESKTFDLEGIRNLAEQLRWHADLIDSHVAAFEGLGIEKTKLQAGNFRKATKILREFISKQMSSKILREAGSGVQAHLMVADISTKFATLLKKLGVDE